MIRHRSMDYRQLLPVYVPLSNVVHIVASMVILMVAAHSATGQGQSDRNHARRLRGIQLIAPVVPNNALTKNQGVALLAPQGVNPSYSLVFPSTAGTVGQTLAITSNQGALGWTLPLTSSNGWTTIGNLYTDSTLTYLGTRASATLDLPLVFRTDGIERMRIRGDGRIGIGTAVPNAQVQIESVDPSVEGMRLVLASSASANAVDIESSAGLDLLTVSSAGSVSLFPFGTAAGNTNELRFVAGANVVGFKTPNLLAANRIWTLPGSDGARFQGLVTNGSGILGWTSVLTNESGWRRAGNSMSTSSGALGTEPQDARLGTLNATDLRFTTGGAVRMIVSSAGAITMGSTLAVNGLTTLSDGTTIAGATSVNTSGTASTLIGNLASTITMGSLATGLKMSVGTNDRVVLASSDGVLDQADFASVVAGGIGNVLWSQIGNGSIDTSLHFLGTTDLRSLQFRTSNLVRLIISSSGDVVLGNAESAASPTASTLRGADALGGNDATGANLLLQSGNGTGSGGGGALSFSAASPGTTGTTANTIAEDLRITPTGDIVIGTGEQSATPVGDTLRGPDRTGPNNTGANLTIRSGNGTGAGGGGVIRFLTKWLNKPVIEAMRIDASGRVGIGTQQPTERLHIAGPGSGIQLAGTSVMFRNPARTFSTSLRNAPIVPGQQAIIYQLPPNGPTSSSVLYTDSVTPGPNSTALLSWRAIRSVPVWNTLGNASIDTSQYVGTSDAQPLSLRQNNDPRIILSSDGRVDVYSLTGGIGAAGNISITAGSSSGEGDNGNVFIVGGTSSERAGGEVTIRSGYATASGVVGGNTEISAGNSTNDAPGTLTLSGGSSQTTANTTGHVLIASGTNAINGTVTIRNPSTNHGIVVGTTSPEVQTQRGISIGGNLSVNSLSVGTNPTFGGTLQSTMSVSGLTTMSGGLTLIGATQINATGTATTTIGASTAPVAIGSLASTAKTTRGSNDRIVVTGSTGLLDQANTASIIAAALATSVWARRGNAITGTEFLGTTDTSSVAIRTNNVERMRISSDGRVLVGSTTGSSMLTVAGTFAATSNGVLGQTLSVADSTRMNSTLLVSGTSTLGALSAIGTTTINTSATTIGTTESATAVTIASGSTGRLVIGNLPLVSTSTDDALVIDTNDAVSRIARGSLFASPGWLLAGGGSVDPATDYVGTSDGVAFSIRTNALERLRLPVSTEVVFGAGQGSSAATPSLLRSPDVTGTNVTGANLNIRAGNSTGSADGGVLVFSTAPAGTTGSTPNSANENLRIAPWGDVVVGRGDATATPVSDTIRGPDAGGPNIIGGGLTVRGGNGTGTGGSGAIVFQTASGDASGSGANMFTERMRISPAGRLGIGTSTPDQRLHVIGNIRLDTAASNTTGQLLFMNPSRTATTALRAGAQTANITYTLPTEAPLAGNRLVSASDGTLSWQDPLLAATWKTTGNANINPAVDYLGTSDAVDLSIRQGGADRILITNPGAVSIYSLNSTAGRNFSITAGGGSVGEGGSVTFTAGSSTSGTGGDVTIRGGSNTVMATLSNSAPVTIAGGASSEDMGGSVTIEAGNTIGVANTTGNVVIHTGLTTTFPTIEGGYGSIFLQTSGQTRVTIDRGGLVALTSGLSVGGSATVGTTLSAGATTLNSTLAVTGFSTLSGGATLTGTTLINATGSGATTIGASTAPVVIGRLAGAVKSGMGVNDRFLLSSSSGSLDHASYNSVATAGFQSTTWMFRGNANTTAATQIIGTTDAQPFTVRTNNAERLRITSDGLVLIGSTSGSRTLDVTGTFTATGNATSNALAITTDGTFSSTLGVTGTTQLSALSVTGASTLATTGSSASTIGSTEAGSAVTIAAGSTTGLLVSGMQQLSSTTTMLMIDPSNRIVVPTNEQFAAWQSANGNSWSLTGNLNRDPATQYVGTTDSVALSIRTNAVERLRLLPSHDLAVGINEGTATPTGGIVRVADAAGSNILGGNLDVRAGNGTGTGGSGSIVLSTSSPDVAGTAPNTPLSRVLITPAGDVVLGTGDAMVPLASTTLRGPDGVGTNVVGGALQLTAGNGTGSGGSGAVVFSTAPAEASSATSNTFVEVLRVASGGNIGIGTNAPSERLHVVGNIHIDTASAGTPGQVRLLNPARTFATSFRAGSQTQDITYTLPTLAPAAAGVVLSSTTDGTMSWTAGVPNRLWRLTGNANVDPTTDYVGTSNDLAFQLTNNRAYITITTGVSFTTNQPGQSMNVFGGNGSVNSGGDITVTAGSAENGSGGNVTMTTQGGSQSDAGDILIYGGTSTSGSGGSVSILGGDHPTGVNNTGNVTINAGSSVSLNTVGGTVNVGATVTFPKLSLTTYTRPAGMSAASATLSNLGPLTVTSTGSLDGGLTLIGATGINTTGTAATTIGTTTSATRIPSVSGTLKTTMGGSDRVVYANASGRLDQAVPGGIMITGVRNSVLWLTSGNSVTNPASHYLGTSSNQPLVLRTNGNERMRLFGASTAVAIGAPTATVALHVADSTTALNTGQPVLTLGGVMASATVGSGPTLMFRDNASSNQAASLRGYMYGASASGLAFATGWTNPAARMFINNSGDVGIGASIPTQRLHTLNGHTFLDNTNNVAAELRFSEPRDGGTSITSFKAGIMGADINYTLPTAAPTAGQVLAAGAVTALNLTWTTPNAWSLDGNDPTEGTHYLGTTTNKRLEFRTNNAERMRITAAGDVGLGNNAPAYKLDVTGDINASGDVRAAGAVLTSDKRLKRDIRPLEASIKILRDLNPVIYDKMRSMSDSTVSRREMGFIAQEVQRVLPIVVQQGRDTAALLSVDYQAFVPLLVDVLQQQRTIVAEQDRMMNDQEAKLSVLEERLRILESTR